MNKIQKAIVNFSKERDAAIIPQAEFILESMTDNKSFPTPVPDLATVQATLDDYSQALSDAASKDRNKIALKNQLRKELNALLSQLGNYVNAISNGDVTMIISSGFKLSKIPQPRYVSTPVNFTVKPGINSGSLVSKFKADAAANSYMHMITPAPLTENSVWTTVSSSRCQYEFTNLQQGKEYWLKVASVGSNDQVAFSAPLNQFTL